MPDVAAGGGARRRVSIDRLRFWGDARRGRRRELFEAAPPLVGAPAGRHPYGRRSSDGRALLVVLVFEGPSSVIYKLLSPFFAYLELHSSRKLDQTGRPPAAAGGLGSQVPDLVLGPLQPLDSGELQQSGRRESTRFFGMRSMACIDWAASAITPGPRSLEWTSTDGRRARRRYCPQTRDGERHGVRGSGPSIAPQSGDGSTAIRPPHCKTGCETRSV